jgi:hypothetical protein
MAWPDTHHVDRHAPIPAHTHIATMTKELAGLRALCGADVPPPWLVDYDTQATCLECRRLYDLRQRTTRQLARRAHSR